MSDHDNEQTEHAQNWNVYLCELDEGQPASVLVDLGYGPDSSDPERPLLIRLQLACHEQAENGFPTREELSAVQDLEDQVAELVEGMDGPIHVGSITTGGFREMIFYAPDGFDGLNDESLGFVPEDRRTEEFLAAADDPEWQFYNGFLYPPYEVLRQMMDEQVIDQMRERGDDLSAPRRVAHWIYFEAAAQCDGFADWAEGKGFEVEKVEQDDEHDATGVRIHHVTAIEPDVIHPIIASLVEAAEQFDGEYDGWETGLAGSME